MQRRELLAGLAVLGGSVVAGCSTASGEDDSEYAYYFSLTNYTDHERTVSLLIEDEDGETIRDVEREVNPETTTDEVTFSAKPAQVTVRVNGRDPREFEWPTVESCRDENKAGRPGLEVTVVAQPRRERDEILYEWGCQAIEPIDEGSK